MPAHLTFVKYLNINILHFKTFNQMSFIEGLRNKAKENIQKIVLPEGNEERTLRAADYALHHKIAEIILLGKSEEITSLAKQYQLENISKAEIIDPENYSKFDYFVDLLMKIRGKKIACREDAEKLV